MRLLIIEDEVELAESLSRGLKALGYAADIAFEGLEGEHKALVTEYDVIILDLNLPDMDGIEICRSLRAKGVKSGILILTARSRVSDKARGLDSGADDYLAKPFAFDELRARIQALLRRSYGLRCPVVTIGALIIDPARRAVEYCGKPLSLTAKEFDILQYMSLNYPGVVSLEEIIEHVWNDEIDPFSNVARVHLGNLRRKLKNESGISIIETVIGKGYKLCE